MTKKKTETKHRPKRRPRPVQEFLPGTAPVKNNRVHGFALTYVEYRDARIRANAEESDAHDSLLHAMIQDGLEHYEYGDLKVDVHHHRKCKVRLESEASEDGEAAIAEGSHLA